MVFRVSRCVCTQYPSPFLTAQDAAFLSDMSSACLSTRGIRIAERREAKGEGTKIGFETAYTSCYVTAENTGN
jgi:hypothetical protein